MASQLFEQNVHISRALLQRALTADGLCMKCPHTRRAAFDEIERLTAEAALELQRSTALPPQGSSQQIRPVSPEESSNVHRLGAQRSTRSSG